MSKCCLRSCFILLVFTNIQTVRRYFTYGEEDQKAFIQVTSKMDNNLTMKFSSLEPVLRLTIKANLTCTITCGINYSSFANVSMNVNKTVISETSRLFRIFNESYQVLHSVTMKFIASYNKEFLTCCITAGLLAEKKKLYFNVLYPPEIQKLSSHLLVEQDENILMSCTAIGNPEPVIRWLKWSDYEIDWIPLALGEKYEIRGVNKWHRGRYKCSVENPLGSSVKYITLEVKGGTPHTVMLWIFLTIVLLMVATAVRNYIAKFRKAPRHTKRDLSGKFDYNGLINRRVSSFYIVQKNTSLNRPFCYQQVTSLAHWQQQGKNKVKQKVLV